MKKPILIHAFWVLIAAGAYFLGGMMKKPVSSLEANSTVSVKTAKGSDSAGSLMGGATGANKASKASKDDPFALYRARDGKISAKGMNDAVQAALRESDPVKSTLLFAQLLENLTAENAPAALKALRDGSNGFESARYMTMLGYAWGQKDGKAAMKALSEGGGRDAGMGRSSVMSGWASANPDDAIKYLQDYKAQRAANGQNNNQGNGRNRGGPGGQGGPGGDGALERGLVSGLAKNNVDTALKYVMSLEERDRGQYTGVLTDQKLKEGGVAGATEWASSLKDEKMKTSAYEDVSRQYARQDLDAAADWASKTAQDPAMKGAVGEVADEMADKNKNDAVAWASKLPRGDSQNEAYEQIFQNWTREDPTAASDALTKMGASPAKDSAIQAFSGSLSRENPQDALTWAGVISDPAVKLQTQIDVARRWAFSRDQAQQQAAQAWIQANLPAQAQQQALQAPQRGGFGGGGNFGGGNFGGGRGAFGGGGRGQ